MKRTLRVLPDAEAELRSAAMWYEEKRRGLGIEFVAVVDRAFRTVLENPEQCPVWRPDRPYRKQFVFNHTTFDPGDEMDRAALAALKTVGVKPGKPYDPSQVPKIDGKQLAAAAADVAKCDPYNQGRAAPCQGLLVRDALRYQAGLLHSQ